MKSFVQANDLRFAVIEEGEGPLVLLCHGFPDTAHTWDDLRPRLAQAGYRAVSPFMRGYAPSEQPAEPPDAGTLGNDVLGLIEALGEDRAVVIGHDWGAFAAYAAASLAPARLERMFVVGIPHPLSQRPTPKLLWHVRHFFRLNLPGAARHVRKNDFEYIRELHRRWSPSWDFGEEDLKHVRESLGEPGSAEAAVSYYRMLRKGIDPLFRQRIEVPTVAFAGEDERAVAPIMFERAASRFNAAYEVVSLPGGHFLHREHPDAFARAVLSRL